MRETYTNPVIPGFFPDPSICRVGDDFYLVASTFTYFPGVPIFTSRNLVDWTSIGHVLDRPSQLDLGSTQGWMSAGVYAPTIRYHDRRFWMITTTVTDKGTSNFFVTADDPSGPWSEPTSVDIAGIDPDLAWDDDGNCWVHFSALSHIARCRIDDATGGVLEPPTPTWSGAGLQAPEAPHLLRRARDWYLLIAEGGTGAGHCASIARGPSPTGPWEPCPANPILSHRSTDRPIQNTGHADLVEAADGSWWLVFLGVRPSADVHVLGRETFLAPVTWDDRWPVVADVQETMTAALPGPRSEIPLPGRDDFDGDELGPEWISIRTAPTDVSSLSERPGWLTVADGGYVARRQQHQRCFVRAHVHRGSSDEAGLRILIDQEHHYDVALVDGRLVARGHVGGFTRSVERDTSDDQIVLTLDVVDGIPGPDTIRLGFEDERGHHVLLELPGRYLSTEVTGGFVGRTIGMFASGGTAAFEYFDYLGDPADVLRPTRREAR